MCIRDSFWHELGAKRVVSARELSLKEIKEIREHIPEDMEIESFIHGAMCISYSGRCLLSNFFTGRDANQGACTHPCRWKYSVVEETRPGEYMPVYENERGTYIFNSKDLCMIEHVPEMIDAGIDSFKIEGRMKTALYVATVARTYRKAIDDSLESPEKYNCLLYTSRRADEDSTGDERVDPLHLKCGLGFPVGLKCAAAWKMMLCGAEKLAEKETMRSTLCELLKLSRHLYSVSVVAKQAPPALSNAKVSCKHGLWLVARAVSYTHLDVYKRQVVDQ